MRLKPIFTITLTLTAMLLVGCSQQDTSLNGPEIASVSLAKGGIPGKPDGGSDGGGGEEATFAVTFSGDVSGDKHSWTQSISNGTKIINTPYGSEITLDMSFFSSLGNCFQSPSYIGPLQVGEAKKNEPGSAKAWFWFNANGTDGTTDIKYMLRMYGTFEAGAPWLPTVLDPNTLTLDIWEMHIEGNKFKDVACTGNGTFSTTVLVERTN